MKRQKWTRETNYVYPRHVVSFLLFRDQIGFRKNVPYTLQTGCGEPQRVNVFTNTRIRVPRTLERSQIDVDYLYSCGAQWYYILYSYLVPAHLTVWKEKKNQVNKRIRFSKVFFSRHLTILMTGPV